MTTTLLSALIYFSLVFTGALDITSGPSSLLVANASAEKSMVASWYDYSLHLDPPLDGSNWSKSHASAASREFPRGTMLNVCQAIVEPNSEPKCVIVKINDFGPAAYTGRGIDLSSYAFKQLAPLSQGLIQVTIKEL